MKKRPELLEDTLIRNYLPADYCDSFSRDIKCGRRITSREFREMTFSSLPGWIDGLLSLRNALVKPLGLDTETSFDDTIRAENENETVFGMPDRHLTFYASLWCGEFKDNGQTLRITTIVRYNNALGKVYFFFIRPFHGLIIRALLKHVEKRLRKI